MSGNRLAGGLLVQPDAPRSGCGAWSRTTVSRFKAGRLTTRQDTARWLVPATGIEPARPEGHTLLRRARLPFMFRHAGIGGDGRTRTSVDRSQRVYSASQLPLCHVSVSLTDGTPTNIVGVFRLQAVGHPVNLLVRSEGLEPSRHLGHTPLKRTRLPVPPRPLKLLVRRQGVEPSLSRV